MVTKTLWTPRRIVDRSAVMDGDVKVNVAEEMEPSQPHGEGENTTFQPEKTDIEVRADQIYS